MLKHFFCFLEIWLAARVRNLNNQMDKIDISEAPQPWKGEELLSIFFFFLILRGRQNLKCWAGINECFSSSADFSHQYCHIILLRFCLDITHFLNCTLMYIKTKINNKNVKISNINELNGGASWRRVSYQQGYPV